MTHTKRKLIGALLALGITFGAFGGLLGGVDEAPVAGDGSDGNIGGLLGGGREAGDGADGAGIGGLLGGGREGGADGAGIGGLLGGG